MLSSLLATSFVEFLKNEWLGLVASLVVLISFLMTNQIKTRIINMVGCIVFVIYGLLLPTYSTAFMNGAVFIVHVVFLIKHFVNLRKEKMKKIESEKEANTEQETTTEEKPNTEQEASGEQEKISEEKE